MSVASAGSCASAIAAGWRGAPLDAPGPRRERRGVLAGGAAGGAAHQRRALLELAGHVLAGLHALGEVGQPRANASAIASIV